MVKIAIRDDDLNYFTKVKDLELLYEQISDFPISYAVIPTVTDVSTVGNCEDTKGNNIPKWIGDNDELCNWVSKKYKQGSIDILMHGIEHTYKIENDIKLAEFEWRKDENLKDLLNHYKTKLEDRLDCKISCFVAPSNRISKYCLQAVTVNSMDFSGIIPSTFQRKITIRNIANYIKRFSVRGIYGLQYPGVLKYNDHLEINACGLRSYDYLKKVFLFCKKRNLPMVVNVHYWDLREHKERRDLLFAFVRYAINQGAEPVTVSQILADYK